MMTNEVNKLYTLLDMNSDKIENVTNKTEYLILIEERKKIIKQLNDLGEFVLDDISFVTPIFDNN